MTYVSSKSCNNLAYNIINIAKLFDEVEVAKVGDILEMFCIITLMSNYAGISAQYSIIASHELTALCACVCAHTVFLQDLAPHEASCANVHAVENH